MVHELVGIDNNRVDLRGALPPPPLRLTSLPSVSLFLLTVDIPSHGS